MRTHYFKCWRGRGFLRHFFRTLLKHDSAVLGYEHLSLAIVSFVCVFYQPAKLAAVFARETVETSKIEVHTK